MKHETGGNMTSDTRINSGYGNSGQRILEMTDCEVDGYQGPTALFG